MQAILSRNFVIKFFIGIIVLLLLSFLRSALIVLMPLIAVVYGFLFKVKISPQILGIFFLIIFCGAWVSFFYVEEFNTGNFILSLYIISPLLFLFFSASSVDLQKTNKSYFDYFITFVSSWLLLSNGIGFVQLLIHNSIKEDDAFVGLYGDHGLGVHTLCIINFLMCTYYFLLYKKKNTWVNLSLAIFFLISGIVSFYGLGLLVFLAALVLYNLSLRSLIRSVFISVFIIVSVAMGLYFIKPKVFIYNYDNLKMAVAFLRGDVKENTSKQIPRKIMVYKNYFSLYTTNPTLFLFGSGPGTFNSRTSFLLNGDYSKNKLIEAVFSVKEPKYALIGAYPLWNSKLVKAASFTDGTRNQPFSSLIAVLSEYGFIFFLVLVISIHRKYAALRRSYRLAEDKFELRSNHLQMQFKYLRFSSLFIFLLLFTDNYLEYPEVILFYILIFKFIELEVKKTLHAS